MNPFWVQLEPSMRIAIVPRPRGNDWLEIDLQHIRRAGVDVLVSMLQPDEADELGLSSEAQFCSAAGIEFRAFPIPDRETPSSPSAFAEFVQRLRIEVLAGRSVAAHCRASIGRSSLLLAALLSTLGYTPHDAFRRLTQARGIQVPDTSEQVQWVERFAARQIL